jgi:hypothetical protein
MSKLGVRSITDAIDEGACHSAFLFKSGGPQGFGARYADMSMGAGTPRYNAYLGNQLESTQLIGSANVGINIGPSPSNGRKRYLSSWMLYTSSATLVPAYYSLNDYLMFYPLVDGDNTSVQVLDNTVTLPRYADGVGVMGTIVCQNPMSATAACTVTYTNSDGVGGRVTTFGVLTTNIAGASVSTSDTSGSGRSEAMLFPLANGDKGIRSIESIQFAGGPCGGFLCFVLVKPLACLQLQETGRATERIHIFDRMTLPEVKDGAYLNLTYLAGQGGSGFPLMGRFDFIWR